MDALSSRSQEFWARYDSPITSPYHIVRRNIQGKADASCSRGWVRVVVQTIFAVITVSSFILIVLMAMQNSSVVGRPKLYSRCNVNNCRILCRDAPYFDKYKTDIIHAVEEAESNCERITLALNSPTFTNATMPAYWMSELKTDKIYDLSILRGNLMHISPKAFMGQFASTIHILTLRSITIRTWSDLSLLGLFNLQNVYIRDCNIIGIQTGSMRAVDDTLKYLTMTKSNNWDPVNVTGTTHFQKLSNVDFSFNYFGDVLDNRSFVGLERCKILYLNSCKITALGPGTFDYLHSIDIIFLNNNLLITVPPGLFDNIMLVKPKPRINLQDNLWQCDCSSNDLRLLVANNLLYVEAKCYNPIEFRDMTFTAFDSYCQSTGSTSSSQEIGKNYCNTTLGRFHDDIYLDGTCIENDLPIQNDSHDILSPVLRHRCSMNAINNSSILQSLSAEASDLFLTQNSWLKLNFFLKTEKYSVVKMDSSRINGYGLVWYQSACPEKIYCVNILPDHLIVYNIPSNSRYTFCPVEVNTGVLETEQCVSYNTSQFDLSYHRQYQIIMYISTGFVCLIFGALCVYGLIRKNPSLLKGSKRILFVKHKTVDALVLPPKIPLRHSLVSLTPPEDNDSKIFIVSNDKFNSSKFNTLKSVKSENSNSPSYVSALQPTDDQLAEWRIQNHFNNELTLTSSSDVSLFSWLHKGESLYHSLEDDKTYESLK